MFRDVLKNLRESKNMTQEQLANAIGVERSSIGKYEGTKDNGPSLDVLKKIASFFHVSIDYLLDIFCTFSKTPKSIDIYRVFWTS